MKIHAILFLIFSLLTCVVAAAADSDAEAANKGLEALKGDWDVISSEKDGKKLSDEVLKDQSVSFKASGKLSAHKGNKFLFEATFEIDPPKAPKTIDATSIVDGSKKDSANLGSAKSKATHWERV